MSSKVKITEAEKATKPDEYVLNPDSGKYVLRKGTQGKQIVAAAANGTKSVAFTHSSQIRKVIESLQEHCKLTDEQIAESLESMVQILPTGSLKKEWGVRLSPKNTTATAYVMFVKSLKVPEGENRMTLAAAFWNNMTDSEKKPYQDSADEANSSKDLDLE